ncbi:MAG: sulfotransferase family 2 domain-containing protein [Lysobacterales bacterium]
MRHVICHYHIYKNSGTTFDHILERNYGDRHVRFDGPFPYFSIGQRELAKVIARNKAAVAFSSHQISLPVPASLEFNVLPVVFVRHPLLRIHSIYRYKRSENDGTLTSDNAARMDFDEWCRTSLAHAVEIVQVSNSQTRMLGAQAGEVSLSRRHKEWMEYDLQQALRNLRLVELLARTEHFAGDIARFGAVLARYGIEFVAEGTDPQNVTGSDLDKTVDERPAGAGSSETYASCGGEPAGPSRFTPRSARAGRHRRRRRADAAPRSAPRTRPGRGRRRRRVVAQQERHPRLPRQTSRNLNRALIPVIIASLLRHRRSRRAQRN